MTKKKVCKPFFIFNPKSYLYGEELLKLAEKADELADNKNISIFVTAPFADISAISQKTKNIIVTAQHLDSLYPGRGMGHVLPESIANAGAKAAFLNHAERPLILSELAKAIEHACKLDLLTIVCADSLTEAKAIAQL